MSTEENKALVRRFIDGYNTRDSALLNAALAPDLAKAYIETHIPRNSTYWADQRLEITDMIAEGDKVWARLTHSGRHIGEYLGLPATGKTKTSSMVILCRVAAGKIAEHGAVGDRLDEVQQLGAKIVPAG